MRGYCKARINRPWQLIAYGGGIRKEVKKKKDSNIIKLHDREDGVLQAILGKEGLRLIQKVCSCREEIYLYYILEIYIFISL